MNRTGIDQIAAAVGGRIIGPPPPAGLTVSGVSTDSRQIAPGDLFVAIKGPRFDGHDYVGVAGSAGAAAALVSTAPAPDSLPADRPLGLIYVRDTLTALGRLAGWHRRRLPAAVVAVTGSNGKTTTKAMIAHMAARDRRVVASPKSFNNAIGLPLTLLSADSTTDLLVCEIGSNAPGEIAALGRLASPDIAVIVTIGHSHLERLRSLEGVAAEKASLLGALARGGVGIINRDRPQLLAAAGGYSCKRITFGADPQSDLVLADLETTGRGVRFRVNGSDRVELPLPGRHNAINALAAIAVGRRLGLSVAEAAERLGDFALPPMRLEQVKVGRITLINDAYNANPDSMAAALETLTELPARPGRRRVFVCGDMLELGEQSEPLHAELGRRIAQAGVDRLIAVGAMASAVASAARQGGMGEEAITVFPDVEPLLDNAAGLLAPGDVVLIKGSRGLALERMVEALGRKRPSRPKRPARTRT